MKRQNLSRPAPGPSRVGHEAMPSAKYRRRRPNAAMKNVKVTYETERVKGTATDCNRLVRIWFTDWAEILPRGCVPVYGVKRKGQIVAPILWHSELLCQHPGSMADCIDAAERARQHWLKYGDPEMPVGDVYGFGATRHSGSHGHRDDEESIPRLMTDTLGTEDA